MPIDLIKQFTESTGYGDAEVRHVIDESGHEIYLVDRVVLPTGAIKSPRSPVRVDITHADDVESLKAAIAIAIQEAIKRSV